MTGACDVVVVELPHGMLGANADLVGRYVATPQRCDRGAWAVLAAFLSSLGDRINGLTDMPDVHLADALVSLVVAAFAELKTGIGGHRRRPDRPDPRPHPREPR